MRGTYYYELNSLRQVFLRMICFKTILLLDFKKKKNNTKNPTQYQDFLHYTIKNK